MKARIIAFILMLGLVFGSCQQKVELVKISTTFGDMYIYLYDATPQHKANFLKLAKEKFFDGTTFHRIIKNFVIQGGDPNSKDADPNNDGEGGPGYMIPAEINPNIKHKYGAVGAARDNNPEKKSNGSQFYIVVNKNGVSHLDGNYTVFGEVVAGMDVAEKIAEQPKNGMDRPNQNIVMKVEVVKVNPSKFAKEHHFDMKSLQAK
jgi:cyclophilin family peptidyl-prolyl cis-trans isomerase